MHGILRFAGTVFNTPQLITQEAATPIISYLQERLENPELAVVQSNKQRASKPVRKLDNVGVIEVNGPLTYKPVMTLCGEGEDASYQSLIQQTEELIQAGAKSIVFEYASPGGQASHCFESVNYVRQLLNEHNVKSVAYVDEMAASAALAWAVMADEVVINPSASMGSIGCMVALMDLSERKKQLGIREVFVTSAPGKIPFDSEGKFTQAFLDRVQADVNALGLEFAQHVSTYTGLSVEEIQKMDATMYNAALAVEVGLANKAMTHREFSQYISENFN